MVNQTIKSLSRELETMAKCRISLDRALDLLEASTQNLEEIIAINTMRESINEDATPKSIRRKKSKIPFPTSLAIDQSEALVYQV